MIDWIKAIVPCSFVHELSGGLIISVSRDGEEEWTSRKRVKVEGSYSSAIHIRPFDNGAIEIDGNPSKFLQGHNIFGSNDLLGVVYLWLVQISKAVGVSPSLDDLRVWKGGDYTLRRVDIAESFSLPCQQDVSAWLRAAAPLVRGKHQAASAYGGETIYIGQRSRRISLKLYNKYEELKKHSLPDDIPLKSALIDYSKNLLRSEVTIRSMELQRRGLSKGSDWINAEIGPQILRERIEDMKIAEKMTLTSDEFKDLPPRLMAVYKLWVAGEDLRAVYPPRTFYRYRAELLRHSIDITVRVPKSAKVVPLVRYLAAEHQADVPQWAYQHGLVAKVG